MVPSSSPPIHARCSLLFYLLPSLPLLSLSLAQPLLAQILKQFYYSKLLWSEYYFQLRKTKCSNSKTILLFKIIVEGILLSTTQDKNAKEWENFRMLQLQKKIKKEKMKTKRGGILDWRWWVELVMI
jgi:hypothetical protein